MSRLNNGIPVVEDDDPLADWPTILGSAFDGLIDGVPRPVTMRAGWQPYGASFPIECYKLGRLVVLQGLVGPSSGANIAAGGNNVVADVPADCYPMQELYMPTVTAAATGESRMIVQVTGGIRVTNELATPYVSVTGMWLAAP